MALIAEAAIEGDGGERHRGIGELLLRPRDAEGDQPLPRRQAGRAAKALGEVVGRHAAGRGQGVQGRRAGQVLRHQLLRGGFLPRGEAVRRCVVLVAGAIETGGHRGEKIVEEARQSGIASAGRAAERDQLGGDQRGRGLSFVVDAAGQGGRRFRPAGIRVDITHGRRKRGRGACLPGGDRFVVRLSLETGGGNVPGRGCETVCHAILPKGRSESAP